MVVDRGRAVFDRRHCLYGHAQPIGRCAGENPIGHLRVLFHHWFDVLVLVTLGLSPAFFFFDEKL